MQRKEDIASCDFGRERWMRRTFLWLVMGSLMGSCQLVFSQSKYDSLPNQPEYYVQQVAKFKKEAPSKPRILFLGNSITEGGNWRKLLKDSTIVNRGISGDNTFGVLQRLAEVSRHKPAKVFLLIGVNDLSKGIPNAIVIQNIFSIVSQIHSQSPKTAVYVQSILPVNPGHKSFPQKFSKQEDIMEINGQLGKYGDALKYTYVDIHSHFLDQHNVLDLRFTYDGLHLNPAGYAHWIGYLKKNKYL